jgi:hypothetical protein
MSENLHRQRVENPPAARKLQVISGTGSSNSSFILQPFPPLPAARKLRNGCALLYGICEQLLRSHKHKEFKLGRFHRGTAIACKAVWLKFISYK